ncbi:acylphosphatase [Capronia epimyces CBS 606.96]|uniref:Acylphosphatase n=1 Tax=Capronia epimyces CBS 606.96 TaxID=1182542 RepID=W9YA41_9EURO|nr:acylphosphatase [Capronia epimyces CBS 606.96]EXJ89348.1 acylphosphatase [Capronia epimyces CBS 606.96]
MSNLKRISFTVYGTVQGVGFRDFVQRRAASYGVTGYVKNTSTGEVTGEAQGDRDSLKKLKADLNNGPRAAHVVKLVTKDLDPKEGESSFDA